MENFFQTIPPDNPPVQPISVVSVAPDPPTMADTTLLYAYCALIVAAICFSLLLIIIILAQTKLRKKIYNQLLMSAAFGGVVFNLLVRPGTIQDEEDSYQMNRGYCGFYLLLRDVELIFMPLALWMMTIERLIALREPENYTKKMTKAARAAMIFVPWVFAIGLASILIFALGGEITTRYGKYPDDPYFDELTPHIHNNCIVIYSMAAVNAVISIWTTLACVVPLLALISSTLALLIIFARRRNIKVFDEDSEPFVSNGSIILCVLLNLATIAILVNDAISRIIDVGFFADSQFMYIHWAWSIVQLFLAILAMYMLTDVKRVMGKICCCCRAQTDEKKALLGETKETQTSGSTNSIPTSIQAEKQYDNTTFERE